MVGINELVNAVLPGACVLFVVLGIAAVGMERFALGLGRWRSLAAGAEAREASLLAWARGSALVLRLVEKDSVVGGASPGPSFPVEGSGVGGPSVGNPRGQPVDGDEMVDVASAVFAVNGLSIRIVHTVPQARSTDVPRLSFEVFCSDCIAGDAAHCVCPEGFDPVVRFWPHLGLDRALTPLPAGVSA